MRINRIENISPAHQARFANDEKTKSVLRESATKENSADLYKTMQFLKEIGKDGEISLEKNRYGVIIAKSTITNKDAVIGTDLLAMKDFTYKYKEYPQYKKLFGEDTINLREKNSDNSLNEKIENNLSKGAHTIALREKYKEYNEDIANLNGKKRAIDALIQEKEYLKDLITNRVQEYERDYVLSIIG